MATPVAFAESNLVLAKPPGLEDDDCEPLSVWKGQMALPSGPGIPHLVSCWKLTAEGMEEINRTKRVWVIALGVMLPPLTVSGVKPEGMTDSEIGVGES